MKKIIFSLLMIVIAFGAYSQQHKFDPPWNQPPESKVIFTVPGVDNVPDLFGDITDPQLVVYFAGNQFMCMDSLIAAFKKAYPQYQRIFVETLPPGILAKQIAGGSITIGNMRITQLPDVYTAGRKRIKLTMAYLKDTVTYAHNKLAIMVPKDNPKHILNLNDLGRSDVKVSMPNPAWEGIAGQIEAAYIKAGGETLKKTMMEDKVKSGTTVLTKIHHRQTPMNIMYGNADAGPVWYSEAYYQQMIGNPVKLITIPDKENVTASYVAGILKNAPHAQAAKDFRNFLVSRRAKEIYKYYGFEE
ncbi:sulfate-binding protein [Arachidicoccus ginsenosidimutans]|uniref:molybdate ABC transporter substrate-binding protein n=1 Tax=Arachidicoccus sp. BS20 TaxID=1850526 RepID=UPI0007F09783|nr:substrate-binding domain-containing protein [Arachidicoccus sp. BS20]ANI89279.1 sulfate-binding protein [Arachidicoccus sp. BS20]